MTDKKRITHFIKIFERFEEDFYMNVSFNGYNEGIVTFEAEDGVNAGEPVAMSANGKVKAATAEFCGICRGVRNGYAAVQLNGYASVPYSGTLSVGYQKIAASSGKIKADSTNGRSILVVDVDSTTGYAGIIL